MGSLMDKNKDKVKLNDELLDMVSGGGVDYCPQFRMENREDCESCGNDLNGAEDCEFCGRRQSWADLL